MQCSIFHLNVNGGSYFQALTKFLQQSDFDILCLQELTGLHTDYGNVYSERDSYEAIATLLEKTHKGELAVSQRFTSDKKHSFVGNGIFYKKECNLVHKRILTLVEKYTYFPSDSEDYKHMGRNVLHLTLEKEKKKFEILTTHLPWAKGPKERTYQKQYNEKLITYIKNIAHPFILTGDFNITADQRTPKALEKYGTNLTKQHRIVNTLDPLHHRVKELFPPGIAVDFIYVSDDVTVKKFAVLEDAHISDHLALTVTVEL